MINFARFAGWLPRAHLHSRHIIRFSDKKSPQPTPTANPTPEREPEPSFTPQEERRIKEHKVDQMWNTLILKKEKDFNLQRELIVHQKQFEKSTKQLRASILFEDLLKREIDIPVYDTKGRPYRKMVYWLLWIAFSIQGAIWSIWHFGASKPQNRVLLDKTTMGKVVKYTVYVLCVALLFRNFIQYLRLQKRYVDRIIYNTERQQFTFFKRTFWGGQRQYVASRFKIIYTENEFLNIKGTNYFDIDTKEEFSLVYKDAWIKQDLFSHLISQRIRI